MEHCAACGLPLKEGQLRCLHCGEPAPGSEARVPASGTRHAWESICGKCGALLPGSCEACLVCGTERDSVPFEGKFPVAEPEEDGGPVPYERGEGSVGRTLDATRRWGGGLTALLLAVVAVISGLGVWRQYFDTSGYRGLEAVLYESGDTVMLSHPGMAAPVPVIGVPSVGGSGGELRASQNGRYLALTTGAGELYQIDLSETASADTAELAASRLADGLAGSVFYGDGGGLLAYRRADGGLYATDYKETWRLDTGVDRIVAVEGQRVLYTRREEGGAGPRTDLYLSTLDTGEGEWTLLDRDVREILDWTPGFDRILYIANRGTDAVDLTLLCYEAKTGLSEPLAEGIAAVTGASAANKTAFYLVDSPRHWRYADFIDDDMVSDDVRMKEPSPFGSGYALGGESSDDVRMKEPSLEQYPELAEAIGRYGADVNLAEVADSEALLIQQNSYETAVRRWQERQDRTEIRRRLLDVFERQSGEKGLMELWAYRAGANVRLDGEVVLEDGGEDTGSAESGILVYRRINPGTLRRTRLSAIWRGDAPVFTDAAEYYASHTREELRYAAATGETASLFIESDALIHRLWQAVNGGVYFTVGPVEKPDEPGELFYAGIHGENESAASVAGGVNRFYGVYRDGVAYGYPAGDEELFGAVSAAQDGTVRLSPAPLSARFAGLENGGQALLEYDPYEEDTAAGTLWLTEGDLADGKRIQLAQDVTGYHYRDAGLIYLEKAGGASSADLYVWRGGEAKLLGKNAAAILYPAGE